MPTIKVRVSGKIAENLTPEVKIVCGNEDYKVEFEFDEPWESANVKTGLFIYNGKLVPQPFDGAVCPMPIVENTTLLAIGVKTSDGLLYTSTPAYADCLKSSSDLATNKIPAPTKDVYDEIIALLNKYISGVGSIDLSDYQKKVDENLPTTNKTIVGAIAEVKEIAETERMVFGETEGTAYEGNKGKANADNIAKLQNEIAVVNVALEQSGLVKKYKQPIEQEYNERVTANGLNILYGSKAVLKKVVGNTVACKNLVNIPVISSASHWGSVNVNFTQPIYVGAYEIATVSENVWRFRFMKKDGRYSYVYDEQLASGGGFVSATTNNPIVAIQYRPELIASGQYSKIMISYGDTALPYQPYFTGLKNAYFKGIKSTGKNLIPYPYSGIAKNGTVTMNGITFTDNGDGSITINGTAKSEAYIYLANSGNLSLFVGQYTVSGNVGGVTVNARKNGLAWIDDGKTGVFNDGDIFDMVGLYISAEKTINNVTVYPMFNYGSTTTYEPYIENTFELPEAVECGLGTTIDFETNKITKEYEYLEQSTPFTEEQLANYTDYIISQDGKSIMYKLETPIVTDFTAQQSASGNEYTSYKGGTEKVLDNDGKEYGAENTLTQDYILVTEVK